MVSADTNLIVRLVARDDPDQVASAEAFMNNGAWVSHIVLAEAVWVLAKVYQRNTKEQITILEMLLKHESLRFQDHDVIVAALNQFRFTPRIGFTDCLILEIARKAGHLPLGTFERSLTKLDGTQKL